MKKLIYLLACTIFIFSCEKEIDVELPRTPEKLVVEGNIEANRFPFVVLTKSSNFFDPTDINSLSNSIVGDATISISDGTTTNQMSVYCASSIPDSLKDQVASIFEVPREALDNQNVCVYADFSMLGETGKTYTITINWNGKEYVSSTSLLAPVPIDSTWFEVFAGRDSLGFVYGYMTEPGSERNQYRWYARRINSYTYGENKGEMKDFTFKAPSNSVFDDQFVNGTGFEFAYSRARGTTKEDDLPPERGFFKVGDTVIVKFCSIDRGVFEFIDKAEEQILSTGNPFAAPINIKSNVSNGALGVWAGYSPYFDTVICVK